MTTLRNGRLASRSATAFLLICLPVSHSLSEGTSDAVFNIRKNLVDALPPSLGDWLMSQPTTREEQSPPQRLPQRPVTSGGSKFSSASSILWETHSGPTRKFDKNPSQSIIQIPLVFFNRIPKTGSTSLVEELMLTAKRSRGPLLFEFHPYKIDIGDAKGLFTDRMLGDGHAGVCLHLARLAQRPYPSVWAFHTPWFDVQRTCPGQWENPVQLNALDRDLESRASHNRAMKHRTLNTRNTGVKVWADEIKWINQLRHPADRWVSSQAYVQACICSYNKGRRAHKEATWCSAIHEQYGEHISWVCTMTVSQMTESALGITDNLPPGGPPSSAWKEGVYPVTRNPEDCYSANWLLGADLCNTVFGNQKHGGYGVGSKDYNISMESLKSNITEKYAWIAILEEAEASIRVLRHTMPSYFKNIKGGKKNVHKGDASQRKDGKISAKLMETLIAALPIDMALYNMVRDDLLKKNAKYVAQDLKQGLQEPSLFYNAAGTSAGGKDMAKATNKTPQHVMTKISRGKARGHVRGLFESWFPGNDTLVTERLDIVSTLLDDIHAGVQGDPGYLLVPAAKSSKEFT